MLTISHLFIYPIKSLGGTVVKTAKLTDRGFEYDRRWMLVDTDNRFLTQREFPKMALLQAAIMADRLTITHKLSGDNLSIPLEAEKGKTISCEIWHDSCQLQLVSDEADNWFSKMLETNCRLVFMPDTESRIVDTNYAGNGELTSLSDGFPLLMIGQASLDDLNSRMEIALPMDRFRPNIVFTGGIPYEEDDMKHFQINDIHFYCVKPCARCPIPTIDQNNATTSKEPLKTLAGYRMRNNNVYFGQNIIFHGEGTISVGSNIKFP
ncbi:MOSC domain-containing protein [soil metagenome]